MARTRKPASPMLGAAMAAIGDAAETLVRSNSRFRHSLEVAVADIHPDPDQARRHFDPAEIRALAATMQAEGQLQPVLLRRHPDRRGQWILVAGERRWRAAHALGWPSLLAIEHQGDADVAALLENLQRVDLTPVEEARGVKRLAAQKGLSQTRIATLLGRSAAEISATLRLLSLPETFLDRADKVPRNVLVELARLEDGAVRSRLMQQALEGSLTVRAIRAAQAAPSASGAPVPPSDPAPSARFPVAPLARALSALEAWPASERGLTAKERSLLTRLRRQIDAQLKF